MINSNDYLDLTAPFYTHNETKFYNSQINNLFYINDLINNTICDYNSSDIIPTYYTNILNQNSFKRIANNCSKSINFTLSSVSKINDSMVINNMMFFTHLFVYSFCFILICTILRLFIKYIEKLLSRFKELKNQKNKIENNFNKSALENQELKKYINLLTLELNHLKDKFNIVDKELVIMAKHFKPSNKIKFVILHENMVLNKNLNQQIEFYKDHNYIKICRGKTDSPSSIIENLFEKNNRGFSFKKYVDINFNTQYEIEYKQGSEFIKNIILYIEEI